MEAEIERQSINVVKTVYEGEIKTNADGNIIVPDSKPDILKVCEVTAEPYFTEKQIEDGKITLNGRVRISILYVPECDEKGIKSISGSMEFCETLKRSEFKDDMTLSAFCDVDKISYKVLNSRKIGIDTKIIIGISVFANEKKDIAANVLADNAQTKSKELKFMGRQDCEEYSFTIDEEVAFPQGKTAQELLKADVCILSKESRALDGKLVIKGKLGICILYEDAGKKYNHLDCEIPFTEVFDAPFLLEDEDVDVSYEICETAYELKNNAQDTSSILVKAEVAVCLKTDGEESVSALDDCYFTDSNCDFSCEKMVMQSVAEKIRFSAVIKQLLQKAEGCPDIAGVYKVQAKPNITKTAISDGKLSVSGKILMCVLYLTDDENTPIASITEEEPFNYEIDCDGRISEDSKAILGVECEHISYTISSKDSVEVRCGLIITGEIINIFEETVISDITAKQRESGKNGIVVYFVKDGDGLWDIAKKYHVKTDSLLSANGKDADASLAAGEKLIIPLN
ncbi:MAG: DUF3794 domain-containing protein [Clostridia bacterium]|nr:DUF3794 domain-containing protein [Clostridia bacterium]